MKAGPRSAPARGTARSDHQRHLEMVFNGARDMMLLAKVEPEELFRVVSVNRTYLETVRAAGFHLTAADLEGRTFAEVQARFGFDAATSAEIRARFAEVIRTGRVLEYDEITRTPAGTFHGRSTITPIPDADGRCGYVLYASQDMTARVQAEQALRESEEKFAKAFQSSPDAISVHELESGRYVEVNDGFLRLFGRHRADVIGRTPLDLGIWAEAGDREGFVARLQRDRSVQNHPVRVRDGAGEIRLCELSAEVFEVGGRTHNVTVLRDVTAQSQAEQRLRESEEKFARAFRASPDAISISDLASGRLIEVNEGFVRLAGYSREEIIGRTADELGFWAEPDGRRRLLAELLRAGSVRNLQMRVKNRHGEQGDFLVSGESVEIGGRRCLVIVGRDIRDRVKAEQALRESEEMFAKAFRSSPQALIITGIPSGRYIDVNAGFEQITGYARAEIIGRTSLEIGIWENLADRDDLMGRLRRDGWARNLEYVFRGKDGRRLVTRCSFELIDLAGEHCLLSVIEDITEQKRAEERRAEVETQMRQTQKLEALGTLAGGIAHDFNNILTAIIVNQELAQMDLHDPEALGRRLAEIGQASNRAKELVRQILTFSRQQTHEKLRQHLQMIVREALGLLRASLPATIEIVQELAPAAPPVLADASQVHQVVMNLCTNAAHAMRHGPGRLEVTLVRCELDEAAVRVLPGLRPGGHARLSVADTGHGMEPAVLARIFEPFFTTKGPGEGTGLGLAMVHGIMKDHGGGIFVRSTVGVGTTFDLYFPEAGASAGEVAAAEPALVPGRGEMILVVDDEEAISSAVGAMLRRFGYTITPCNDPRAALELIRATPDRFALLLTDRTMPHLSGPELIAQAWRLRPDLPALVMSGLTSPGDSVSPDPGAGFGLVAKPIEMAELSRAVRKALDAGTIN